MSDWMALWTRMNTFPPSRYRCATDIVKVERISQFLFDLAQYLALFRTGRIPIRIGRREAGKGCWGHLWLQSSCICRQAAFGQLFVIWCGKIAVREGSESGDVGGGKVLIAFPYRR